MPSEDKLEKRCICIVGGGAAGYFSAIHNKLNDPNADVVILEKSSKTLRKVKISGGGRCNVTHSCFDPKELVSFYPRGSKELLGPFHSFQPADTMAWFEDNGVPLKVEEDGRVFPESDLSQDIIDCLKKKVEKLGIRVISSCGVTHVSKLSFKKDETTSLDSDSKDSSDLFKFRLVLESSQVLTCEKLVLATGSSPIGYAFAARFGHSIQQPIPSLFTFKINERLKPKEINSGRERLTDLAGCSVANAEVWLESKPKEYQTGPVLITHWGLSAPAIIKLSAWQARFLFENHYSCNLIVNWSYSIASFDRLNPFSGIRRKHPKKLVLSLSPFKEIPARLWVYLCRRAGITQNQQWHDLSKSSELDLVKELTESLFAIDGKGQFKEEFVTCGGVSLSEVNFKTMESKVCKGLFIVGELLDIDGVTGGFNFQNAWTTGFLSGAKT
ncbi:NAD(P)/FAD-dependent oxidoreductase [bacterium]|jgi:predicted Rossmann fold flavoprotein|nr:NAD(P)/FAD-dependent oxidoreductase [bacterium]